MVAARMSSWIRVVGLFSLIPLITAPGIADEAEPAALTLLELHIGQHADGTPTERWLNAARRFNNDGDMRDLESLHRPFTADEAAWLDLIVSRLHEWQQMTPDLQQPFAELQPPALVDVLVGNVAAADAFIADPTTIAFDLGRLQKVYGAADLAVNTGRIDRFFAHEYTHVLHKVWQEERGLLLESPLERALWACLKEGVGNLRSLSARWRDPDGSLSQHAEQVLDRLAPVFVSRLDAIESATADEAADLMQGLSMGPFEQKWGALPVALWLAAETAGDEAALSIWIERGPWGVIELAQRHLSKELAAQLPVLPESLYRR